jgi:hypothetical protein
VALGISSARILQIRENRRKLLHGAPRFQNGATA